MLIIKQVKSFKLHIYLELLYANFNNTITLARNTVIENNTSTRECLIYLNDSNSLEIEDNSYENFQSSFIFIFNIN